MNVNRPRVYLETSVVSYLVSRPVRDVVVLGHQETTRTWWDVSLARYSGYVSELVCTPEELTYEDRHVE